MSYENSHYSALKSLDEKARKLAIGRICAVFLLMAASWFWNGEAFPNSLNEFTHPPLLIFIVALLLAAGFWASLCLWKVESKTNLLAQLTAQFITDTVLITWLVWTTGDVKSPYITLYTVLICLTSIFFNARGTMLTAISCTLIFTATSTAVIYEFIPRLSEVGAASLTMRRAWQIVGFHDAAFLFVGLLAAQLAQRHTHSNVRLLETEQNLANLQRLHERIVQSIRSGLVTTDLEGRIYLFNSAAEEITGYKSEEVRGWKIFDLLGNIEQPIAVALESVEKGEQPPRFEADFSTPDGFGIRLGYGISPLFSESGETTGLILTFQDLTDMRAMEESIRRKDRLAAVGRVAAGLAHEIRNPLGAMRGAIQVLKPAMQENSSQAQLMDIVMRESDRLNTIITNFLTYARPKKGEITETDVCETLRESITLLRHSPDLRSVHNLIEDLPDESVLATADAAGLKQVFWNLARNAVQAMPDGGELAIKLKCLNNNRLQILFSDTGCGMPAAQVERLFEPFSQSTTGGTGLGLSIVYQIIRDHNGTINVRSQEHKGTTITVELPIEAKANSAQQTDKQAHQAFKLPPVPLDGVKVFDDTKVISDSTAKNYI
ncbi:MAG TPA: ATP-binding protein [Pyrinomonadaceae bacterium]|jgi:two-component system sensor histidine kinase PilS (NtrC family)